MSCVSVSGGVPTEGQCGLSGAVSVKGIWAVKRGEGFVTLPYQVGSAEKNHETWKK